MKFKSVFAAVLVSFSIASLAEAHVIKYECRAETGSGNEVVRLAYDINNNSATLSVDKKVVPGCKNVATKGDLVDYGQATVKIKCDSGVVKLIQNYDETTIEIEALKLGLSDTTYMCI